MKRRKRGSMLAATVMTIAALTIVTLTATVARADDDRSSVHRIKHVWVITLENEGYDTTFGPNSKAPYLSKTLPTKGVLLSQYYGTGHASLDNYVAMVSGQAATVETRNDCLVYADFVQTGTTPDGQVIGHGCVYPAKVKTIADQLTAAGRTWRAYMEDMGNDPSRESKTCGHPVINTTDLTQNAEKPSTTVPVGDAYATRHNGFAYFHSVIDSPDCFTNMVSLNQITADLKSIATTPNVSFITPNLCHDGHDVPCVNGEAGGLVSADAFLQTWVPVIMNSPAYQRNGLLIINFDEGGFSISSDGAGGFVVLAEGETCCSQRKGPNLGAFPQSSKIGPYTLSFGSYGGDRTGAVLLSPFVNAGTVSNTGFNHYSMLKTIEDIFGLDYLGYAAAPGLVPFFGCAPSDVATDSLGEPSCGH
jgi:phospholipase C